MAPAGECAPQVERKSEGGTHDIADDQAAEQPDKNPGESDRWKTDQKMGQQEVHGGVV